MKCCCGTPVIIRTNLNIHLREQAGVALPLASSLGGGLRKRIRLKLEQPSDAVPILLSWLGTVSWNASFLVVNCDCSRVPFSECWFQGQGHGSSNCATRSDELPGQSLSTASLQPPFHPSYSYRSHNHDVVRSKVSYRTPVAEVYFESPSELEAKNSILFWRSKSCFSQAIPAECSNRSLINESMTPGQSSCFAQK
ncbi:hypothetical protein CY34DRAFT_287465 [Suillus luteus UH-Slu-Lm8-n1]|uniref:Uncharacterized protein n=1 Tax=Suillus luteus UH-Slu-Lm8-n1 TaxID=930992 RepID=A0A0D0B0H1_9AGAM|nr:hypothetical protein CY34DRAFT_287465 [Suillus luteus UH-Slu-Lm8-n1]